MKMRAGINAALFVAILVFVVNASSCNGRSELKFNFYKKSCPSIELHVKNITWRGVERNPTLPAKLLRLQFHDCFVRGCEASILLDSTAGNTAEKEAVPNLSVGGYEVIDEIKSKLEQVCPGVVSCADIIALATKHAVAHQYGASIWEVRTGRKDGRESSAAEALTLPSPFADFATLREQFASKGLDVRDLVALSGAHTVGVTRCGLIVNRLYNFSGKGDLDADPSLDPAYVAELRQKCPKSNFNRAATLEMDPGSSLSFDSNYYRTVLQKKGIFQSDAALLDDFRSASLVMAMSSRHFFFAQFGRSMRKMSELGVLKGDEGEIRKHCRVVN